MQAFERFLALLKYKRYSVPDIAKELNFPKSTLYLYLNEEKQDKLLPLFYDLIALWPDISRDWLFFGEGEMLAKPGNTDVEKIKAELAQTKQELEDERAMTRKLVSKMLLQDADAKDGAGQAAG